MVPALFSQMVLLNTRRLQPDQLFEQASELRQARE
jgi:hypothetical protein